MQIPSEFESIRCFEDEEIRTSLNDLFADKSFRSILRKEFKVVPIWLLSLYSKRFNSVEQIQRQLVVPIIKRILRKASDGISSDFSAVPVGKQNFIYLSNHRDIVLDSALLDYLLLSFNKKSVEIGIGDNLLIHPWIETLVRLNRSFIVKRSVTASELLRSSMTLSAYMRFVIQEKKSPIWLAQREGRAKDSDDRTQKSVIKMLIMSGEGSTIQRLQSLNIVPLTISYEYDPCDYLKAREFQQKRDNPDFKKSQQDDLINMKTGIFGYKGRIHYHASPLLNDTLSELDESQSRNQLLDQITSIIDNNIFKYYKIFPGNYVALDLLNGNSRQSNNYSAEEKLKFESYIESQLAKIELPSPDWNFLREKILLMYANPLINQLSVLKDDKE